eukprot:6205632-Pleurochrysis_carterae.AAC.1
MQRNAAQRSAGWRSAGRQPGGQTCMHACRHAGDQTHGQSRAYAGAQVSRRVQRDMRPWRLKSEQRSGCRGRAHQRERQSQSHGFHGHKLQRRIA